MDLKELKDIDLKTIPLKNVCKKMANTPGVKK